MKHVFNWISINKIGCWREYNQYQLKGDHKYEFTVGYLSRRVQNKVANERALAVNVRRGSQPNNSVCFNFQLDPFVSTET